MRLHWRRVGPGELDHELIWLLVSVTAAVMAAVWLALHLPWPRCGFLALTGVPCFTCGATRAGLAFLQGNFLEAWRLNPLVSAAFAAVAVFDLYAFAVLVSRAPRARISLTHPRARRVMITLLAVLAVANWTYVVATS